MVPRVVVLYRFHCTPDSGPFSLLNLPQSLEDIQKYLTNVWEGHIIITDCWYAANFENKQQTQLYVGKLTQQFLLDENDTVKSIELEELILKFGGGTDLEQPFIGNQSYGIYKLGGVIAGPLVLIPRKNGNEMKLYIYPSLLRLYTTLDRQQFI